MAERKQKRVKRRRGFVDVVNALLTLIVLGLLVIGGLFVYGAHSFYAAGPIKADTNFVVEKGNNLGAVGAKLEEQGLIDSRYIFQLGGFAMKKQGALKVGEYKLAAGASMFDILKTLTEGKPVLLAITIPEGFTVAQVVDRLKRNDRLTGDITNTPPEGSILPDTYDFDPGATRQSVLDRMQNAMKTKLADIWQSRDPAVPLTTPAQLVTLASIVEKETPVPDERAKIAGVYYNRLVKHMRLQSDPTVVYGITGGVGAVGRAPTRSEIDQPTPYNTYQINGLPPTPIANPGVEALKAAANPDKNPNVYFVAVSLNPKDGHVFAADYADHRKNVAKLRALEKQQAKADAESDADAAKDTLEQQQAAAAGDPTAGAAAGTSNDQSAATAPAAPADTSGPAPSASPPSLNDQGDVTQDNSAAAPDNSAAPDTGSGQSAPATTPGPAAGDSNAPIPMPADQRPGAAADNSTRSEATKPATKTAPARPAVRRPQTAPDDTFGG